MFTAALTVMNHKGNETQKTINHSTKKLGHSYTVECYRTTVRSGTLHATKQDEGKPSKHAK